VHIQKHAAVNKHTAERQEQNNAIQKQTQLEQRKKTQCRVVIMHKLNCRNINAAINTKDGQKRWPTSLRESSSLTIDQKIRIQVTNIESIGSCPFNDQDEQSTKEPKLSSVYFIS
jgi:hypothetical protein